MTYNCQKFAQDLQSLKETFSVLKNQLEEFEDININPDISRAERITKLKELYQTRKKLQEMYPPVDIMKAWAENYLETHTTSRKIAQTQEQALSGKYLIYLDDIDCRDMGSADDLKLPKVICGNLELSDLTSAKSLILPKIVGGSLDLSSLTSSEYLNLPSRVENFIFLYSLTAAENLEFPEYVGGLNLNLLKSLKGVKLPKFILKNFYLRRLSSIEGLDFSETEIIGAVHFKDLSTVQLEELRSKFPHVIMIDG